MRAILGLHRARSNRSPSSLMLTSWATIDPSNFSEPNPHHVRNLIKGKWTSTLEHETIIDPLNGEKFLFVPKTSVPESKVFAESLNSCPKSGLHNPIKNPERYLLYGDVAAKAATKMSDPKVLHFFARLIQRVAPKSLVQAIGEVKVTQKFLENFGGDQVRFLARSFSVPGDHFGQSSHGYRL